MNIPDWLKLLMNEAQRLQRMTGRLGRRPEAAQIQLRMQEVWREDQPATDEALCVALWGGTGCGKSTLFNALAGLPPDADVSHGERAFTKTPRLAVSAEYRALFEDWGRIESVWPSPGVVLVDCPDMDSIVESNRASAARILDRADVIVVVTTPDKRANFDIAAEILRWASRKRWFFVMNKSDTLKDGAETEMARRDFHQRIRELGFEPGDPVAFLAGARDRSGDYESLSRAIFSARATTQIRALRQSHAIKRLQFAFKDDLFTGLAQARARLKDEETRLQSQAAALRRQALENPMSRKALARMKRERIWRNLAPATGGTLSFFVFARARIGQVMAAFYTGYLFSRGHGLRGLMGVAWTALKGLVDSRASVRQAMAGMDRRLRDSLRSLEAEARRALEDEGAMPDAEKAAFDTPPQDAAQGKVALALKALGLDLPLPQMPEETPSFDQEVDVALDEAAARCVARFPRLYSWLGNALPIFLLLDFIWRLGEAWVLHIYPGMSFYGSFASLFLLSHLPGFFLAQAWVSGRSAVEADVVNELVAAAEAPEPIRSFNRELGHFFADLDQFRMEIAGWAAALDRELQPESFGAAWREDAVGR